MLDLLLEFITDLLLEGSFEIGTNKKVSKYIRYPILIFLALIYLALIALILFVGISALAESVIGGILIILVDVLFIVITVCVFYKKIKKKEDKSED